MSHEDDLENIETTDKGIDFGSVLAEARKANNYTVEEISAYIKIPVHTIAVLESDDLDALPAPTFAQGYIRAYAKFLEISEDDVLEKYYRAVPQAKSSDLKPRSNLPGEASSQSPIVKSVTILLIVAGIATVIFGSFNYYQEKAGVMEGELDDKARSFTGNSLDSPGSSRMETEQIVSLSGDDDRPDMQTDPVEQIPESGTEIAGDANSISSADVPVMAEELEKADESIQGEAARENDVIEIFAENGSWMEVRDANKSRLFYNMVPVGGSKVLVGHAPFSITMGNANTTRVVINDIEVDIADYIRANNTAIFRVSTDGQDIIFH